MTENDVALVACAERIARAAHAGQTDKAGRPYIGHPQRVAAIVTARGGTPAAIAAAWLHDVLEDTDVTGADLADAGIPRESVAAVEALTKRAGESLEAYYAGVRLDDIAVLVKTADLDDNTSPARQALLDDATRERLQAKYARARELLARRP